MKTSEKILTMIKQYIDDNGYAPTVREIGDAVGLSSSSTVHSHLERLKRKGYIQWDPTRQRTLKIIREEGVLIPVFSPEGLARAYKKYGEDFTKKAH